MIEFAHFTPEEQKTVDRIVERASKLARDAGVGDRFDPLTLQMDLSACHADVPLRLDALAAADGFDFAHDVFGIMRHMDRETGKLGGCFLPRYAALDRPT
ncbi:MAG: DUF6874 family protein [Bacillota bacterium]